jgi:hypothetical protein
MSCILMVIEEDIVFNVVVAVACSGDCRLRRRVDMSSKKEKYYRMCVEERRWTCKFVSWNRGDDLLVCVNFLEQGR